MTPDTFTQWLATCPPLKDVEDTLKTIEAYRSLRLALENKWDKLASPYTGWGTEQQRYRLYTICETLATQGYKVVYNFKTSTENKQVWDVAKGKTKGTLWWYANTGWFSSSVGDIGIR